MRNIIFILAILSLTLMGSISLAEGDKAGADTHGGAVIRREGKFLTFGQAGAYRVPIEEVTEILPEVVHLVETLKTLPISQKIREQILEDVIPTSSRRYFKVARISDEETIELLRNFKELNLDMQEGSDLTIAAYTDVNTRETFLLPVFFELEEPREPGQDAILLHEAAWSLKSRLAQGIRLDYPGFSGRSGQWDADRVTYALVVELESAFEAMLRCKTKCLDAKYRFYETLNRIPGYSIAEGWRDGGEQRSLPTLRILAEVERGIFSFEQLETELIPDLVKSSLNMEASFNQYKYSYFLFHLSKEGIFASFVKSPKSGFLSDLNSNHQDKALLKFQLTEGLIKYVYGSKYQSLARTVRVWIERDKETNEIVFPENWIYGNIDGSLTGLPLIVNSKTCIKKGPASRGCHAGYMSFSY